MLPVPLVVPITWDRPESGYPSGSPLLLKSDSTPHGRTGFAAGLRLSERQKQRALFLIAFI